MRPQVSGARIARRATKAYWWIHRAERNAASRDASVVENARDLCDRTLAHEAAEGFLHQLALDQIIETVAP